MHALPPPYLQSYSIVMCDCEFLAFSVKKLKLAMCDCESVYLIHGVFSQHASFAETSYFHLLLKLMKAFEPTFEP